MNRRTLFKVFGFVAGVLGGLISLPALKKPRFISVTIYGTTKRLYRYTLDGHVHEGTWSEFMSDFMVASMTDPDAGTYFEVGP